MTKRISLALALALLLALPAVAGPTVIVIDPGHGGVRGAGSHSDRNYSSSNNATSPIHRLQEKHLTLEFSEALEKAILAEAGKRGRTGIEVVLTRRKDVNLDFTERAGICARHKPAAIISIHFNASSNAKSLGTLCLVKGRKANPHYETDAAFARGLASACSDGIREFVPQSRSLGVRGDEVIPAKPTGFVGSYFFFQLDKHPRLDGVPRCFLEVDHMDHAAVETSLLKNRRKSFPRVCRKIAAYLVEYLGRNP